MKKLIFGSVIFCSGLLGSLSIWIMSIINPWSYNNLDGLAGFLMGTKSMYPFITFLGLIVWGFILMYRETFSK